MSAVLFVAEGEISPAEKKKEKNLKHRPEYNFPQTFPQTHQLCV